MKARVRSMILHPLGSLKRSSARNAPPGKRLLIGLAPIAALLVLFALVVRAPFTAATNPESISTFASDCSTEKDIFFIGETVCAIATDSPLGPPAQRFFEWVAPDGTVFQLGPEVTGDPQSNSLTIPNSPSSVGTWQVKTVDRSNNGYTAARFRVQDPNNAAVDLWCPISAPFQVSPGSSAPFTVFVTNKGPNDAQNVRLTVTVATNSTFDSQTQESGPTFTCTNPSVGSSTGVSTCTIATLPSNTTAQLTFIYTVNSDAAPGTEVSSTATVTSDTNELATNDNSFTASVKVSPATCEITCPSDIVETKDAGQCGKTVTFATPTGSGTGCGTIQCSPSSGSVFPVGTTNVVCFGESGGPCSFTVTIQDTVATITCPSNVSVNESSPGMGFAVVNYPPPTISDNCSAPNAACDPPSGSSFPVGTTVVTCQNSSSAGTATCTFNVTVNSIVCIMNCPDDVVAAENPPGSGSATVTYPAPTTSGCPSVTITCTPSSGSSFPAGSTVVDCSARDQSNNTVASCSFTVTVTSAACVVNCPDDVTAVAAPGQCGAVVSYPAPTTSGNCSAVTCIPASGSSFPIGNTNVTCTPQSGASCSFTVTVQDVEPPVITCPANQSVNAAPGQCSAVVSYPAATATDNCPGVAAPICDPPSGSNFNAGVTTVTCTVIDASENPAVCEFTVTVIDEAPTMSDCPADIARSNDANQCGAVVTYTDPTASDTCSSVTVSCSPTSGSFFPVGETNVSCIATDATGNTDNCSFKVTVSDTQPPTITCPANITKSNDANQCGAVVNYNPPAANDNCPGVESDCSPESGSQFPVGTTTVNCTASDAAGNTATCSFTVTVTDNQPPTITCSADITVGTDPNSVTATVTFQTTVSDNCTGVTSSCTPASGSQFSLGTTTVNCTATDGAGLTATCSFTVTVTDTQPPTITCPANITKSNDANQCGAVVTYPNPQVTDNSAGATFVCSPNSGSVFLVGVTAVTCTATDIGGNKSSCTFQIEVKDTQPPAISCPANITVNNVAGQCSATVNPGVATASDNCTVVTVVGVRSDGLALNAPYPVGTTTIIWTARDAAVPANVTSCMQTIVVNDTQAPTITMASGQQLELWPPNHQYRTVNVSDLVASASDNCGGNLTSSVVIDKITSDEPDDASGNGDGSTTNDIVIAANCKSAQLRAERQGGGDGRVYTITFKVKDSSGNVTTATAKVTVPKSQGNNGAAVDSGVAHTVNGTCP